MRECQALKLAATYPLPVQEPVAVTCSETGSGSIARHFGVSARTVRRRIAALLDELDATGRFQAGVRAVKRGLL